MAVVKTISARIAEELDARVWQVEAAVKLLDEDATVPFIARYRKEATGGLDDGHLRRLQDRLRYIRGLEGRRETILRSIAEQGRLTPELEREIGAAETRTRLEDLYLPFRKKRRTRAQLAREAGLEQLADTLLGDPTKEPLSCAGGYFDVDRGVPDAAAALEGARHILVERFAEDAQLLGELREHVWQHGVIRSRAAGRGRSEQKGGDTGKFADYFDYCEPVRRVPSHRALALLRGSKEKALRVGIVAEPDDDGRERTEGSHGERSICRRFGVADRGRPCDGWLIETARCSWKEKVLPHLEGELTGRLRDAAEEEARRVFAANLRDLLLAAPAGPRVTIGLDPGLRTGVKVAVVHETGKLVEHGTIFPHAPRKQWEESVTFLAALARRHGADLVAIGNGTASRETDRLAGELIEKHPDLGLQKLLVSESGASVYSASELAAREFPELDVSFRGAVSIARRLQDPLAELVKIEPRSIGVGQYQHDVNQKALALTLDGVVEDCVNAVGVDVNTASSSLLSRVSGLNRSHAERIVAYRDRHGAFDSRKSLLDVQRFGAKTFELSAGFLRIRGGSDPLDASAVHPEAYPVVERLLAVSQRTIDQVIGDRDFLSTVDLRTLTDDVVGLPTVKDIIAELEKPGRDPRPEFKTAVFRDGVEKPEDLQAGMVLEGVVTNVTNFGAFVDIGVHRDGLVHVSALSDRFVKDPHDVVKAGDVVKVKVMDIDLVRKRIGLSLRLDDEPGGEPESVSGSRRGGKSRQRRPVSADGRGGGPRGTDGRDVGKQERGRNVHRRGDAMSRGARGESRVGKRRQGDDPAGPASAGGGAFTSNAVGRALDAAVEEARKRSDASRDE